MKLPNFGSQPTVTSSSGSRPGTKYHTGAAQLKGPDGVGVPVGWVGGWWGGLKGSFSLRSWMWNQSVVNEKEPGGSIRSGDLAGGACRIAWSLRDGGGLVGRRGVGSVAACRVGGAA